MARHPPKLSPSGDVLVGTGLRAVKLGFMEIQVYELGLYVDGPGCRSALLPVGLGNRDRDDLLSDRSFFPSLVAGSFRKTFRIVFCRSLAKEKMTGGFDEPLRRRVDEEHTADAAALLAEFIPSGGVDEGDVLTLTCEGDGETVKANFLKACEASSGGIGDELVSVKSGGEGGAWAGFQNIFFDDETQIPTIRVTAVADLPDVLVVTDGGGELEGEKEEEKGSSAEGDSGGAEKVEGASSAAAPQKAEPSPREAPRQREPSVQEIDAAIDKDFVQRNSGKMTWSDFAGRDPKKGKGYRVGDVTTGVVTAMHLRKPHPDSAPHTRRQRKYQKKKSEEEEKPKAVASEDDAEMLRERLRQLEIGNRNLQVSCHKLEYTLANIRRTWPIAAVGAVAMSEVTGVALVRFHGVSSLGLLVAKLVLCFALGGTLGMRYVKITERMEELKKDKVE